MANFIAGKSLRRLQYGEQVTKSALSLPQSATSTLFTVTGGTVLISYLFGVVSTATGSTVTTLALGTVPTTGTSSSTGIGTATAITSLEAGTFVGVQSSSNKGGALLVGTNASTTLFTPVPFLVPAGTITWTTSASDTGAMSWYLTYVPLDDGAAVS